MPEKKIWHWRVVVVVLFYMLDDPKVWQAYCANMYKNKTNFSINYNDVPCNIYNGRL